MIYTKKTDNGIFGFGSIDSVEDGERLLDALMEALFGDEEDEDIEEQTEDEDVEEKEPCDEEEVDVDGLPHVVAIGYADDEEEVVVMNDYGSKWGLCAALLEAVVKEWPETDQFADKLKVGIKELAEVCRERVETDQ